MSAKKIRADRAALAAAVVLAVVAAGSSRAGQPLSSTLADRIQVDVTVYNHDLALIREVRELDLPRGQFVLEFQDVPAQIQPATLLVAGGESAGFAIWEQNYEFDLMSEDKVLEKYLGRQVQWLQEDGSRWTGTLLGLSRGPVFEVDGEIMFDVPGRIVLPELPQNLRARPTLVWRAQADRGGKAGIEASYLSGGWSWQADYVLQLDREAERADLQAWVTITNRSGASYSGANLLLVAGDINRAPQPAKADGAQYLMALETGRAPVFDEETLYDYHLYTLDQPTDLKDLQIKQISLFEAGGLEVDKKYSLRPGIHFFRGTGPLQFETKVDVAYTFSNSRANQLGVPLPAGVVRVYGLSSAGGRQLLGEDRIDHTPQNETVSLTVGKAFDVVAERVRTDSRRVADNLFRYSFKITLRNHRQEAITVEVVEPVGGDWDVLTSTHPERRVSATALAFDIPVPANDQAVLEYTVEVRY